MYDMGIGFQKFVIALVEQQYDRVEQQFLVQRRVGHDGRTAEDFGEAHGAHRYGFVGRFHFWIMFLIGFPTDNFTEKFSSHERDNLRRYIELRRNDAFKEVGHCTFNVRAKAVIIQIVTIDRYGMKICSLRPVE